MVNVPEGSGRAVFLQGSMSQNLKSDTGIYYISDTDKEYNCMEIFIIANIQN